MAREPENSSGSIGLSLAKRRSWAGRRDGGVRVATSSSSVMLGST